MRPPGNGHDSTTPPATTYRDTATGLHLQSATGEMSVRIARSSRGPLDPPPRQGTPDASWSRYDVTGWTVYTAETRETAYAEVLAYTKRRLGQRDPLAEDAAAIGLSLAEFTDLVGQEWSERQHMGMGHLPASWRIERLLYRITLPTQGWWIDVEHPDSLAAIEAALEPDLAALNVGALTVAALRGEDRHITTTVVNRGALGPGAAPRRRRLASRDHLRQQARHRTLLGLLAHRHHPTGPRLRRGRRDHRHRCRPAPRHREVPHPRLVTARQGWRERPATSKPGELPEGA